MANDTDAAKAVIEQADRSTDAPADGEANAARRKQEELLDDALANTFPASDPVALS